MMTQKEAIETFLPRIESEGRVYEKFALVDARPASPGERVVTVTSDGKETENTAKDGDVVVKNYTGAGEIYLLPEAKFKARYEWLVAACYGSGWDTYKATGHCRAFRYDGDDTEFTASWGESMRLRRGDMVCTPLPEKGEVYRIAAKEFGETYREAGVRLSYDRRS